MRRKRSLGSIHVVLFYILESQALTMLASVSLVGGPTQALSSTARFSTFSPTRPLSFQPYDSGTPTTSRASGNSSISTNSNVIAQLPLAGPVIAGVLVGIIAIAAIVVICFLQRRPKRPRRQHCSFEAQFTLQPGSHPHRHSKSVFLRDEIVSENRHRTKKYRRYSRRSRYSSGTIELEVRNSLPQDSSRSGAREIPLPSGSRQWHGSTNSTFSSTLNRNKTVNNPNHHVVNVSQTSIMLVPLTVSSNQVEQHSSQPTIELPPQPLSSSSQNEYIDPSLPETGRQHVLHLEEKIQILRRQDMSLPQQDTPPPYEDEL